MQRQGSPMEVDVSRRNMRDIEENVRRTVEEFQAKAEVTTRFKDPVIAYLSTTHPLFDTFFARGENDHPKKIYRPGNTLIVHYVPWAEEIIRSNQDGDRPSQAWMDADRDSLHLAMAINQTIRKTLNKVGRLHSNTSSMIDWDKDLHRYSWSNKIAGFIAGIGTFGPAGSFRGCGMAGSPGSFGRVGSVSTAALYAPEAEPMDSAALEAVFAKVMADCCFAGSGADCTEEMIAACPGGAIGPMGIDRAKCQAHCAKLDPYVPAPESCGKCFRFAGR